MRLQQVAEKEEEEKVKNGKGEEEEKGIEEDQEKKEKKTTTKEEEKEEEEGGGGGGRRKEKEGTYEEEKSKRRGMQKRRRRRKIKRFWGLLFFSIFVRVILNFACVFRKKIVLFFPDFCYVDLHVQYVGKQNTLVWLKVSCKQALREWLWGIQVEKHLARRSHGNVILNVCFLKKKTFLF